MLLAVGKKSKYFYMKLLKTLFLIFITSFFLNLVWENLHVFLYAHYKGGIITESILLHATFMDAIFITTVSVFFLIVPFLQKRLWIAVLFWVLLAVGIELWALETNRWAYNSFMPVLPFLGVGLTPTIQLGILGYISLLVSKKE